MMKKIPIRAAEHIAKEYGYDQVFIYARKVGDPARDWMGGGEHVTTYGVDRANCKAAAMIGDFLKYKIMGLAPDTGAKDRVIAELMDRRLLNDVDNDLWPEIAEATIKAVHG